MAICLECQNTSGDERCAYHEEKRQDEKDPTGVKRFTKVFANEMDRLIMAVRELTKEIKDLKKENQQ